MINNNIAAHRLPLYLAIRQQIRADIAAGVYEKGLALPSENMLAERFNTTRLTIRKAIDELVEEGIIIRVQGRGVFVVADEILEHTTNPRGFRKQSTDEKRTASVRVLEHRVRPAGPYYSQLFNITPDDKVCCIRRLNSLDGIPQTIEQTVVSCSLFPGVEELDLAVFSLYEFFSMRGHTVMQTYETIDLAELSARQAQLLQAKPLDPALILTCKSFDKNGILLELATSVSIRDAAVLTVRI
ncbi:GntR family transcriptional regulator [Atopobium fossor]|uniref:GntR family transcriptional regulator n=1 Tax=Atopobium fossor TaxID=39487 RepID=UPI00041C6B67|nr:GntR family transcriptional regulator [Atopobium fossor]